MKVSISSRPIRPAPGYTMVHVHDDDGGIVASGRLRVRSAEDAGPVLEARQLPRGPAVEAALSVVPTRRGKGLGAALYAAIVKAVAPLPLVSSSLLPDSWGKTSAGSRSIWRSAALAEMVDVRDGVAVVRAPAPPPTEPAPEPEAAPEPPSGAADDAPAPSLGDALDALGASDDTASDLPASDAPDDDPAPGDAHDAGDTPVAQPAGDADAPAS